MTNALKSRLLKPILRTNKIRLKGVSGDVQTSRSASWKAAGTNQSFVELNPISLDSGVNKTPYSLELASDVSPDFISARVAYSTSDIVYQSKDTIVNGDYDLGDVIVQGYRNGSTLYNFILYHAKEIDYNLFNARNTTATISWDNTNDLTEIYSKIADIQGAGDGSLIIKIDTGFSNVYVLAVDNAANSQNESLKVIDEGIKLSYRLSNYTSGKLDYPEGVQIDVNKLTERL